MVNFIINADDYGETEAASAAIVDLFREDLLDRTTMIVNRGGAESFVERARENGFLNKIGLHLNIYDGRPLTQEICACPRFVSDGEFNHVYRGRPLGRFLISRKEKKALAIEADAQFKRFLELLGPDCLRHFDSHHHTHIDWSVWGTIKKAALANGFTDVRLSQNVFGKDKTLSLLKRLYKALFNKRLRKDFSSTTYFSSVKEFANVTEKRREEIMTKGTDIELMCHPKYLEDGSFKDQEEIEVLRKLKKGTF